MINDQKKADNFIKAINAEAEEKCRKIKEETDLYVNSEIEKAVESVKDSAKAIAKVEAGKISEQNNSDSYKNRILEIKKIVKKRQDITNEVFAKAEEKIKEFTESENYGEFLKSSAEKITQAIGKEAVIFIREKDSRFAGALKKLCNDVQFDNSIILGGCKGENKNASLRADDTLDVRFEEQKKEFYSFSGLSVTG